MVTVWGEGKGLDGLGLLDLEEPLGLAADTVGLEEIVEGGNEEDVHGGRPVGGGDLGAHELLELLDVNVVLFVHNLNLNHRRQDSKSLKLGHFLEFLPLHEAPHLVPQPRLLLLQHHVVQAYLHHPVLTHLLV